MLITSPQDKQQFGIDFLKSRKVGILGYKTGMGKSFMSLAAACDYLRDFPDLICVVFAPKNAEIRVWKPEISKHTSYKCVDIEEASGIVSSLGMSVLRRDYKFVICRYSRVRKYSELLRDLCNNAITIYDEAHYLKSPKAKMVTCLRDITNKVLCKWGLTATSILNSIQDLWGIMNFFKPQVLGNLYSFQDKYCTLRMVPIGGGRKARVIEGYKNFDLLRKVVSDYIITAVQDFSVKFHKLSYDLSDREEDIYTHAARGVLRATKSDGDYNIKGFAQRLPDLQRVVDGSRDKGGVQFSKRSSKYFKYLPEFRRILDKGESVIVFTEYRDTLKMLAGFLKEDFPNVPLFQISGDLFEQPDQFPCIVAMTAGGAQSLNFKFANHVFFYSIPFSVGIFIQVLGRITRMDSKYLQDLNCYVPKNDSNIDRYKYELLEANTQVITRLLGEDANLPKSVEAKRKDLIRAMRRDLLWRLG